MFDEFGRKINYLRLSVTDKCNLRCRYCMPQEGVKSLPHSSILTIEEMVMATEICAGLGVDKVRITGGEPLVKRDILTICEKVAAIDGIEKVAMTTNGILLPALAKDLKNAGVSGLNISLDTLNREKYHKISRIGELDDAIKGIHTALETGFEKVKINVVLIGGFNTDEIRPLAELTLKYPVDVRFIELMPMAEDPFFSDSSFVGNSLVLQTLPELEQAASDGGVARLFSLPGALGKVGLISPVSNHFCSECNRIRITADGYVKPCLHSRDEYLIKGLDRTEMERTIRDAIMHKPRQHENLSYNDRSQSGRDMNAIGG